MIHRYKPAALIICLLLGWLGIHHYYLGNYKRGILYFFTSWTMIPAIICIYDFIQIARLNKREFERKYNFMVEGTGSPRGLYDRIMGIEESIARIDR